MIKTGTWSPEGLARPTDQSVAQAIRALSPLRAGGSAGVWSDNTMLWRHLDFRKTLNWKYAQREMNMWTLSSLRADKTTGISSSQGKPSTDSLLQGRKPVPRKYLKCLCMRTLLCIDCFCKLTRPELKFGFSDTQNIYNWGFLVQYLIFLLKRKLLSVYLGSMCLSVFVSICVSPCASVASSSLDSVSSVTWPGVSAGLVMAANKWKWKTHLHFQCTFPQFPQFHSSSR